MVHRIQNGHQHCIAYNGWIAYHLRRDDYPKTEVVLANFLPDGDNGSYKWYKHDWKYEAEYYREQDVPVRVLF